MRNGDEGLFFFAADEPFLVAARPKPWLAVSPPAPKRRRGQRMAPVECAPAARVRAPLQSLAPRAPVVPRCTICGVRPIVYLRACAECWAAT